MQSIGRVRRLKNHISPRPKQIDHVGALKTSYTIKINQLFENNSHHNEKKQHKSNTTRKTCKRRTSSISCGRDLVAGLQKKDSSDSFRKMFGGM